MTEPDLLAAAVRRAAPEPDTTAALDRVRSRHRRRVRRTRIGAAVAGVVVVTAATVGAFALDRERPAPEAPPTTDGIDVEVTVPEPGVAVGRHPVRVVPSAGLVEGEEVTVSGRRFPADVNLGVTMCLPAAVEGEGVGACDITAAQIDIGSGDEGRFEVTYTVRRLISMGDGVESIDCATVEGGCIIAVGAIDDYEESGGMTVSFDPAVAPPALLAVSVSPDEGLVDGDEVQVEVTELEPGAYLQAQLCALDAAGTTIAGCDIYSRESRIRVDHQAGRADFPFVVSRLVANPFGGEVFDCLEATCVLVVDSASLRTTTVLAFDADAPPLPEVEVDVAPTEDLAAGDRIEVRASGLRPGVDLIAELCPEEAVMPCSGEQLGYTLVGDDSAAELEVVVVDRFGWYPTDVDLQPPDGSAIPIDCTERPGRCHLVVHLFYEEMLRVPLTFGAG